MKDKKKVLDILIYGNEVLRQKAGPLEKLTDADRKLIERMAETMYKNRGIGLAANQVGILKQIVVIDIDQLDVKHGGKGKPNLQVFLNPEIISESAEDTSFREGCLSLPGIEADVYRPLQVEVTYYDLDFQPQKRMLNGFLARVIQHEIDHLNGVLFIDHLSFIRRAALAGQLNRLKKESRTLSHLSQKQEHQL